MHITDSQCASCVGNSDSGLFQIPGSKVVFPGGTTAVPLDQPPRELHELSSGLTNATMAIAIVLLAVCTLIHIVLAIERQHIVVKVGVETHMHM